MGLCKGELEPFVWMKAVGVSLWVDEDVMGLHGKAGGKSNSGTPESEMEVCLSKERGKTPSDGQ